ncbi:RsmE family RNA methyltransferase [Dictyoglomus thermophilum]|nr:16S rRNA (uracil(1498)-N(3))-methyltransferase [Dictyoglomus thermophilum]
MIDSMSPTFFATSFKEPDLLYIEDKEDIFHLVNVLRVREGEKINVNYNLKIYETYVERIEKDKIVCRIIGELEDKESNVEVYLCQSLPKRESWEIILEKCTEIGVVGFIPLQTQRSIVNLSKDGLVKKYERWNKIIREAVKQCGRNRLPLLYQVKSLEECLSLAREKDFDIVVAWEGAELGLKDIMNRREIKDKIFLFIGPEGSFADEEIELMKKYGGIFFNMGPRILKVETAAIVASALLLYEKGGLGLI